MAFSLRVQNDTGTTTDANGYITVAEFKAYHDDRGGVYGSASDTVIGIGIVRATDYVDTKFAYKGDRLTDDQTTEWPRTGVLSKTNTEVNGIPRAIKNATAEYALRAMSAVLVPDLDPDVASGGVLKSVREKVDVLETETVWQDGAGPGQALPAYPAADLILSASGFLLSGSTSSGGRVVR